MIPPEEIARWREMGERLMFGTWMDHWHVAECPACGAQVRVPNGPCWMSCACGATFESRPGAGVGLPRDTAEASVWPAKRPEEVVALTEAERAVSDRLLASVFGE